MEPEGVQDAPVLRQRRLRRRAGWMERILTAAFIAALLLYAYDYLLTGSQGTGILWYQTRTAALEFLSWRIQAYVWVLVPLVGILTVLLRGVLPVIEIPIVSGNHAEARWVKHWYIPGTLRSEGDQWTWREGRYRAYIDRRHLARRGTLGWGVTVPVERTINDADGEVLYDTAEIPTYVSRATNRRLFREVQERVVQDHRALKELMK